MSNLASLKAKLDAKRASPGTQPGADLAGLKARLDQKRSGQPKLGLGQRAAYSLFTTPEEKQGYLQQQFGTTDVAVDEPGVSLGDVADFAGPALEYGAGAIGGILGAAAGPAGSIAGSALGQAGGYGYRKALAGAVSGVPTNNVGGLVQAGTEGAVSGVAGAALQGAVNLAKPGYNLARKVLNAGPLQTTQVGGATRIPAAQAVDDIPWASAQEVTTAVNPALAQAQQTATAPIKGLMPRMQENPLMGYGAVASAMVGNLKPVAGVAALSGAGMAKDYLSKLSAQKVAALASQPGGYEALKQLATPGISTAQATALIRSLGGAGIDSLQ